MNKKSITMKELAEEATKVLNKLVKRDEEAVKNDKNHPYYKGE